MCDNQYFHLVAVLASSGLLSVDEASFVATAILENSSVSRGKLGLFGLQLGRGASLIARDGVLRIRAANVRRDRGYALVEMEQLSDLQFVQMYRLNRVAFDDLLEKIAPKLAVNEAKATASSGSPIAARTRLAVTLRFLAGGSYLDICFAYGIAVGSFFGESGPIWPTMEAINKELQIQFGVDHEE